MQNKIKTVVDIENREEKSIVKIRDFLRANAGLAYSAEDITNEIGINGEHKMSRRKDRLDIVNRNIEIHRDEFAICEAQNEIQKRIIE